VVERCFVIALLTLSIGAPTLLIAGGKWLGLERSREIPVLEKARAKSLADDPVQRAKVDMYLSEAQALFDQPAQRDRACKLLLQARKAASQKAKDLYAARCAE